MAITVNYYLAFRQINLIYTALADYLLVNYVRYTPIRNISEDEKRELYDILDNNPDIKYRAKIVL
ncbi:MAG: hypothetical protein WAM14_16360, partial [Candidatus Nitrosopolaris sp.]